MTDSGCTATDLEQCFAIRGDRAGLVQQRTQEQESRAFRDAFHNSSFRRGGGTFRAFSSRLRPALSRFDSNERAERMSLSQALEAYSQPREEGGTEKSFRMDLFPAEDPLHCSTAVPIRFNGVTVEVMTASRSTGDAAVQDIQFNPDGSLEFALRDIAEARVVLRAVPSRPQQSDLSAVTPAWMSEPLGSPKFVDHSREHDLLGPENTMEETSISPTTREVGSVQQHFDLRDSLCVCNPRDCAASRCLQTRTTSRTRNGPKQKLLL